VRTTNKNERFGDLYPSFDCQHIRGVVEGFTKILEINGVGYKAAVAGKKLTLNLGYSHPIEMEAPNGIDVKVEKNVMTITGIDKQAVGQFAAVIREQRPPEPYKGKGIKYSDEVIRRKAGKVVKAVGGGK
jgi:large subunit ribosomal protein L6